MLTLPTNQVKLIAPMPASNQRRPFLTPLPDLPGEFLLVLDNTSLDKLKRCHRCGENYLIRGREPHARNAALTFGGAIHEALEIYHRWQHATENAKYLLPLELALYTEQVAAINSLFGQAVQDQAIINYFAKNPIPSDILSQDYRTPATALEVMKHYRKRNDPLLFPDYEMEIMSDEYGPIIERAFELPLAVLEFNDHIDLSHDKSAYPNQPFVSKIHLAWSGRIDLVARINGKVRVVDHKTSSIDSQAFTQNFQMASQTVGYEHSALQLWPDLGIEGFCCNAIYLKKPTGNAGLTERGPRGGDPALRFDRHYYDYSLERRQRWERDTILLIEDFLHSMSRNIFPQNDRACFDKYGRCPYYDACVMDSEASGYRYLESDAFKPVTWNPTSDR